MKKLIFLFSFLLISACGGDSEKVELVGENLLFGIGSETIPKQICEGIRGCAERSYAKTAMEVESILVDQMCPSESIIECGCGDLCSVSMTEKKLEGESVTDEVKSCILSGFFWGREAFSSSDFENDLTVTEKDDAQKCFIKNMRAAMCQDRSVICFDSI